MPATVTNWMASIELRGLKKSYHSPSGPVKAVLGIDIDVHYGETVARLGPNGAGKSTTVDILLGLQEPNADTVAVFGGAPARATHDGRIGAMLQGGGVLRDLTVRELVEMMASLFPTPLDVDAAIAHAQLSKVAERRTERLSGGETQRLRFAVALISNPDLLVLDEPTVGMDVESRRAFWTTVRELARAGRPFSSPRTTSRRPMRMRIARCSWRTGASSPRTDDGDQGPRQLAHDSRDAPQRSARDTRRV